MAEAVRRIQGESFAQAATEAAPAPANAAMRKRGVLLVAMVVMAVREGVKSLRNMDPTINGSLLKRGTKYCTYFGKGN